MASGLVVEALFPLVPGAQTYEIQPSEYDEGSHGVGHILESKEEQLVCPQVTSVLLVYC